ncbi:hypothetical protein GIB67_040739 [Kingdonia uniflora]|uniref:RING-type domain-containing protein n=1 Tax=Kingdonia uniflora TaxID=39325 RepID=A0A7J7KUE3_9MAGN|nr:hypothetical protein GIB67_040739 [Kingdonia uniflora]
MSDRWSGQHIRAYTRKKKSIGIDLNAPLQESNPSNHGVGGGSNVPLSTTSRIDDASPSLRESSRRNRGVGGSNITLPPSIRIGVGVNTTSQESHLHRRNRGVGVSNVVLPPVTIDVDASDDDVVPISWSSFAQFQTKKKVPRPPTPPPPPPPPPTFSCPICMGTLVDESSTKCGHIFCKRCITAAIAAQKKCPTCRQKLLMKDIFRVYLPDAN